MIGCHSVAKCRFEAQQRYASTVTPIINSQFSILNFQLIWSPPCESLLLCFFYIKAKE